MFETLWFRQAGLAFGNSVWASGLVLAGFMGGIALGNMLAAKEDGRFENPIRLYAFLELIIGVTGISLVYLLPYLGQLLAPWLHPFLERPWILNPLRVSFAFLLLLIPSTAMGMTLPLLTKALSKFDPFFGRVLGRLYGWNTLGAVFGVLLAEFLLVGALGVRATAWFAGILNLIVFATAWRIAKQGSRASSKRQGLNKEKSPQNPPNKFIQSPSAAWRYLCAAFLAGFSLLALEVIWFRFLMLFVTGHSTSFSLMLTIILAGIAFGGFVASFLTRVWPGLSQEIATIAFLLGLFSVLVYAVFPLVVAPYTDVVISNTWDILAIGIPLMFPVSFLSGFFFTVLGTALRKTSKSDVATTGSLTFSNTCGAALGAFCAGFFFLPVLGMEKSLFLVTAIYGGMALLLMTTQPKISRVAYVCIVFFALSILFFPSGAMQEKHLLVPIQRLLSPEEEGHIAGVREGRIETISYLEQQWMEKPLSYRLLTDSYSMSSSDFRSRRYMKLFVYWPVAVHPDPKTALLISYGIGSTAKALTDTRALQEIDVVDISQDILEMNDIVFPDAATHPLRDSRVRVHIEDGRYFLQTTDKQFDLITAEPPPPEISGVVNLYTREYFRLLYDRLNEGGMVTYWLPLHALSAESVKAILRAFCDVFEDCSLWHGQWLDLMMVGTRHAKGPVSEKSFKAQWQDTIVARELNDLGFERPEQLGALFIGDADYLNEITRGTPPLVDDFPKRIQTATGRRMALVKLIDQWINTQESLNRFLQSDFIRQLWPAQTRANSVPYFKFQEILHRQWFGLRRVGEPIIADLHTVLTESPLETLALWLLGSNADIQRILADLRPNELENPMMQVQTSLKQIAARDYDAAADSLRKAEKNPNLQKDAFGFRVYSLVMAGRNKEAEDLVAAQMAKFLKGKSQSNRDRPALSPFWGWMKETLEIDPFAIAVK